MNSHRNAHGARPAAALKFEHFSSFPHGALPLLLENMEMVALKEPTTVASQAQRFHVARAEKVSPELAQVAQEFLATEH